MHESNDPQTAIDERHVQPYPAPMALPTDDDVLLLHNPRCSKSRTVKSLLEEKGIAYSERRYLEEPLDAAELADLATRLERPVREWTRTGEGKFKEAGLDAAGADEVLIEAIAATPVLMERPIVVRGARAIVGRPPSDVLELFEDE